MRKIFFLLLLLVAGKVSAKDIYYTKYNDFSDYQATLVETSELVNVETKPFNRFYKEEIVNDNYYLENENNKDYPFINKDDYQTTIFSEWSSDNPVIIPNRIIESKNIYEYANMKEIRYIHFYNLSGGNGALRITELNIYSGSQEIPFNTYCTNCSPYFTVGINDGEVAENQSAVYNGAYLRVDLGNYYDPASIKIDMYIYDVTITMKQYSVAVSKDSDLAKRYASQSYADFFTSRNYNETFKRSITMANMIHDYPEYYDWQTSESVVIKTATNRVVVKPLYRYQDIKYMYYAKNIIYSDYMESATIEYPNKVEEEALTYYRFQTRNKLEVDSPINLKDGQKIDTYISATSKYQLIGLIDYTKNANYDIKIIMDDLEIPVTVAVNYDSNIPKIIPIVEDKVVVAIPKKEVIISDPIKEVVKEEVKEVAIKTPNKIVTSIIKEDNLVKPKTNKSLSSAFYAYIIAIIVASFLILKKHI